MNWGLLSSVKAIRNQSLSLRSYTQMDLTADMEKCLAYLNLMFDFAHCFPFSLSPVICSERSAATFGV